MLAKRRLPSPVYAVRPVDGTTPHERRVNVEHRVAGTA